MIQRVICFVKSSLDAQRQHSSFLSYLVLFIGLLTLLTGRITLADQTYAVPSDLQTVEVGDGQHRYNLNQDIHYWRDPKGKASFDQVLAKDIWKPGVGLKNSDGPLNLGYTSDIVWIAVPVRYTGNKQESEWWLELDLPLLEYSRLYLVNATTKQLVAKKEVDYHTPFKNREIAYATPVYKLHLRKDQTYIIYLRVANDFSIHLPLVLTSPAGFAENVAVEEMMYGSFFGAMLIMLVYNFFVYLSVRETSFIWYIFYIGTYMVFLITERVHGVVQLFGDVPRFIQKDYLSIYIWLSWIFAILMGRSFLETRKRAKGLDKVLIVFLQGAFASLALSLVIDLRIAIQWAVLGTIVYAIVMIWIAYTVYSRGNNNAKFYLMAWIMNFGGVVVYALMVTGILPFNMATSNAPHIGILFQLTLISFAMSDRIKVAQRQALVANSRAMENLQRYHALFDHAVEGICQIGLNRRFIDANPAMAKMMGFSTAKTMINLVPDAFSICFDETDRIAHIIQQFEQGVELIEQEASFRTLDDEQRWATSTLRMNYDRYGVPQLIECTFVDITERIEKEKVEKDREQERVDRQVAESSAAAKSQFLANMSHEIRTPLTAIIGYGESLLDEHISEEERIDSAEVVVRSGRHLLELINDILDHSKIDADKLDVEVFTVDLLALLSEVKTYFDVKAAEKGIEFAIQYEFPLPEQIMTDPTRLKQILINLCGNALKFTDHGGITVIACCDREAELATFKVVDTGTGVKSEQLARLFDPFAQASPSIARQYGGTGLGLSISKRLANMLGGDVIARSVYGEGSEFEVSVATGPLNRTSFIRNSSELNLRKTRIATAQTPALKGRVLYAEDNVINQKLINQLVSKTGAILTIVNNGAEALEIASREQFDLILMDIQMPVMDGRDATKAIRDAGVNTAIVALTANVMAEDVAEYKEAGCNETVAKPVIKQQFYEMLGRYLSIDENMVVPHQVTNKIVPPTKNGAKSEIPQLEGKVILAEDNSDNRMLMTRYLNRAGLEVISAEDGEMAVKKALTESVNLVLMDQHMPKMNGPKATQMLRQTGFSRPILAFTASDASEDIAEMQAAGCNGVIEKPIKTDQLYAKLAEFLPAKKRPKSNLEDVAEILADSHNVLESEKLAPIPAQWLDEDLLPIVEQFVEGIPQRLESMITALNAKDWATLQGLAHQIKGTGSSLGFPELTEAAKVLEQSLKKELCDEADIMFEKLQTLAGQMQASFSHFKRLHSKVE
jgi:PAS domain S-box-containing protein